LEPVKVDNKVVSMTISTQSMVQCSVFGGTLVYLTEPIDLLASLFDNPNLRHVAHHRPVVGSTLGPDKKEMNIEFVRKELRQIHHITQQILPKNF